MTNEDDHVPHLLPVDPIVKITRWDVALALFIAGLAVVWLALHD